MASTLTRTMMSLAACVLIVMFTLVTLPIDAGTGVTIISFI